MIAKSNKFFLVFIALNLFLTCFYIDTWDNANTTSRAISVIAIVDEGTLAIDNYQEKTYDKAFINGHYYSEKAPLPTFLIVPFYAFSEWLGNAKNATYEEKNETIHILGSVICGGLPFVIIVSLLFYFAEKNNNSNSVSPVVLAMLPVYGSYLFNFLEPFLAILFLLLCCFLRMYF